MRCPNCGNENPPDYLFCDECGARLIGNDVAAMAGSADGGAAVADAGGGGGSTTSSGSLAAAAVQGQPATDVGGAIANYADYGMGASQPMPPAIEQGTDTSAGYVGLNNNSGPMNGTEDSTGLSAMPVTEDTMGSAPDEPVEAPAMPDVITPLASTSQTSNDSSTAYGAADDYGTGSAYGDAQDSLMGMPDDARMSVEEGLADITGISGSAAAIGAMPDTTYPDEEEAVPAPSGDTGSSSAASGGNEWAANALALLHRAQGALSGGDWGMFGEVMHNLAATLTSAANGATASAPESAPAPATPPTASEPVWSPSDASVGSVPAQDDSMSAYMGSFSPSTPASDLVGSAPASPVYEAPAAPVSTPDSSSMSTAVSEPAPATEPAPSLLDSLPATPSTVTPMATAAPVQAPGASGARLILISTGAEMAIPDQEEITVGREDPSSGIFPDIDLTPHGGEDGGVSRRHARMLHIGDDYFVEDLQSTNFTKLDGQRLPAHVRERLEDGARLDFGRVAMIFRRG